MRRFLLLHGSWHGAWCWFKVAPLLRREGEVLVPNLPGRGRDPAFKPFVTLGSLVEHVSRALSDDAPATVVVHSRSGIVASMLAEKYPRRVRRVVYLASYLLRDGETAAGAFRRDVDSYLQPFVEVSRLGAWDRLDPAAYREGLYADCSDEDVTLASSLLCAEPSLPSVTRLRLGDQARMVPRAYIRLTADRAVTPRLQDELLARSPVERVESLDASHSAYFSRPEQLAATVLSIDRD
jgi:pimeloyl-ACP methyl ester carboxylesterase